MIGDRIRLLREQAGYSQADLARRLSTSRTTINSWESECTRPAADYLIMLTKELHTTADFLLGISHDEYLDITDLPEEGKKAVCSLVQYISRCEQTLTKR